MTTTGGRIFISYRRQETAWPARQLYEALCERYGASQVFKDVDNIAPGEDFVERVSSTVTSCQVLIAMLGPRWADIADDDGNRRIDDPDDFVRLEVGTALSRGVLVVPILVDGAALPRAADLPPDLAAITRRQAVEISPTGFNLTRLYDALDQALRQEPASGPLTGQLDGRTPAEAVAAPGPVTIAAAETPRIEQTPSRVPEAEARPAAASEPAVAAPRRSILLPVLTGVGVVALAVVGVLVVNLLGQGSGIPAAPPTQTTSSTEPTTAPEKPTDPAAVPIAAVFTLDQAGIQLSPPVVCTTGRVLSIEASGEVLDADGLTSTPDGAAGWFDAQAPLPEVPLGALIASVGGSPPVFVGDTRTLVCPTDGELSLTTNSQDARIADGELTGTVTSRDALTEDDLVIDQLEVPANASWVRSNFECVTDHHYRVSATGIAGAEGAGPEAAGGPDGVRFRDGEMVPGGVAADYPHRSLLGRIGEGAPFLLGSSATLTCPDDGPIDLQTNDGVLEDNTGSFHVTLSRWPDPPR
ncbi:MAG: toll/interleukin-1 receptor domain-containing protein [Propionibacteriaceae bacterium]|nr:toll/interleukin-1 receptor domain-containing protein [Propionibacteriaceae bacterium]